MNKTIATCMALAFICFILGRYSAQAPEVKTTVDSIENIKKDLNQNTQTHQVSVSEKTPDGTTKITTTTDTSTVKKVDTIKAETTKTVTDVIPPKVNTVNVSFLVGLDISRQTPVYGVSLTKQVLGPITIGAFGLNSSPIGLPNSTIGLSIGVNF